MYCRICGARVRENLDYCPKCGAKMESAERRRLEEEARRQEEDRQRRAEQAVVINQPQHVTPVTTNGSGGDNGGSNGSGGSGSGGSGKPGVNKSLVFIVVIIALLVGYSIYNSSLSKPSPESGGGQSATSSAPGDDTPKNDAPSEDTPKSDTPTSTTDKSDAQTPVDAEGYWWTESSPDENGRVSALFLIINDEQAYLGLYEYKGDYGHPTGKYTIKSISMNDLAYDSSSDAVVFDGDMAFKRANDQQIEVIKAVVKVYAQQNGS